MEGIVKEELEKISRRFFIVYDEEYKELKEIVMETLLPNVPLIETKEDAKAFCKQWELVQTLKLINKCSAVLF